MRAYFLSVEGVEIEDLKGKQNTCGRVTRMIKAHGVYNRLQIHMGAEF